MIRDNSFNHFAKPWCLFFTQTTCKKVGGVSPLVHQKLNTIKVVSVVKKRFYNGKRSICCQLVVPGNIAQVAKSLCHIILMTIPQTEIIGSYSHSFSEDNKAL